MNQFDDIRPFNDQEVKKVINELLSDEELIDSVVAVKLPVFIKNNAFLLACCRPIVKYRLHKQFAGVENVRQFQDLMKTFLDKMISSTTTEFTYSGLDKLSTDQAYLFMSNHRDIALDPAFVNFALYKNGFNTVRIAIGDNLLKKPFVSNLMRLNKSFIVKRSAKGPRQILAAYKLLSNYIHHSIVEERASIWIAQREGRAKDGIDKTEPAIIKMLAMNQDKKTETFAQYIKSLNIVPVTISYEFDPCDGAKSRELYEREVAGKYEKGENEDVLSIATGIIGFKGKVHVSFGRILAEEFETPEQVANAVDQQVISNYQLQTTNYLAYKMLTGHFPPDIEHQETTIQAQEPEFKQRLEQLPDEHREYALGIYANSVFSQLALS